MTIFETKLAAKAAASPSLPPTANVAYRNNNTNNNNNRNSRNNGKNNYRHNNNNINNWNSQAQHTPRPYQGKCQICGVHGHSARRCSHLQLSVSPYNSGQSAVSMYQPWQPRANITALPYNPGNWLMDTGATHHLTSDLNNLALHQPYTGGEEVTIADGSGMPISHTGEGSQHGDSTASRQGKE